jgi:glycosyltransferase involved in cell wall biosynthesis
VNVVWSLPVRGETLSSSRGDVVRPRSLIAALRDDGHRVTVVEDSEVAAARVRVAAYRRVVRRLLPRVAATAARDLVRVAHGRDHGRRVAAAVRRVRADLIIETQVHFAGSGVLASRRSGVPLVLDDCSPWEEEVALGSPLPGLARRVFRSQARAAVAMTASTAQIRHRLVEGGAAPGRTHVVPNGVDLEAYAAGNRNAVRRRMGWEGRVVAAFVGSFQPWHRTDLLLEALRNVGDDRLHVVLVGDGPGREPALSRAAALGLADRVTSPGPLSPSELARLLTGCDLGVLPASNEYGQPMKLLDYAAASLAIVAADVPPVRDMIEADVTGRLVPPGDATRLAAVLLELAGAPRERDRLGAAARRRLAAHATWRSRARLLLQAACPVPADLERRGRRAPMLAIKEMAQ